jgi:colicin import membrane protein
MAADKRENSVLFSLRELRKIEEDRVKHEENTARQKVEDERRAREDEVRRAREAEEQRLRAIEDAQRAREEEEERRAREDALRIEEAERRHRVEAQARLEEQRLRMEIEAKGKMATNKRIKVLMAVAAGMLIMVAGLGIFLYYRGKEMDRQAALNAAALKAKEDEISKLQQEFDKERKAFADAQQQYQEAFDALGKAQDEESRKRLRAIAESKKAEMQRAAEAQERIQERARRAKEAPVDVKCKNPNDPLCGVN